MKQPWELISDELKQQKRKLPVTLSLDNYTWLKLEAEKRGVSMNALVNVLIAEHRGVSS